MSAVEESELAKYIKENLEKRRKAKAMGLPPIIEGSAFERGCRAYRESGVMMSDSNLHFNGNRHDDL